MKKMCFLIFLASFFYLGSASAQQADTLNYQQRIEQIGKELSVSLDTALQVMAIIDQKNLDQEWVQKDLIITAEEKLERVQNIKEETMLSLKEILSVLQIEKVQSAVARKDKPFYVPMK